MKERKIRKRIKSKQGDEEDASCSGVFGVIQYLSMDRNVRNVRNSPHVIPDLTTCSILLKFIAVLLAITQSGVSLEIAKDSEWLEEPLKYQSEADDADSFSTSSSRKSPSFFDYQRDLTEIKIGYESYRVRNSPRNQQPKASKRRHYQQDDDEDDDGNAFFARYQDRSLPPIADDNRADIGQPIDDEATRVRALKESAIEHGTILTPDQWDSVYNYERNNSPLVVQRGNRASSEIRTDPLRRFVPKIRPECEDTTVCEKVNSYPKNYVENLAKYMEEFRFMASTDEANEIGLRIFTDDRDTPLCQSNTQSWLPEAVKKHIDDPESWHLIVNVPNFRQIVRIERCVKPDGECVKIDGITSSIDPNYKTYCRQQYVVRKIVVLNRTSGLPIPDIFRIPSGCCCHVKVDNNVFSRLGKRNNRSNFNNDSRRKRKPNNNNN